MDSELIRKHIRRKKTTFIVTIALLLILTVQFYYLNCYVIYIPFFCELSFVYAILAIIVANIWFYFTGPAEKQKKKLNESSENSDVK